MLQNDQGLTPFDVAVRAKQVTNIKKLFSLLSQQKEEE
jgi:hypothetical protein